VILFTKGYATETVWIYDARTNRAADHEEGRPLTPEHFKEFEKCYGATERRPSGSRSTRKRTAGVPSTSPKSRSANSTDGFKWLKEESLTTPSICLSHEELATMRFSNWKRPSPNWTPCC